MDLSIREFTSEDIKQWDEFILNESINGTFLQTRNFLNYHPIGRFTDSSLIIYKGKNTIVAVIPACILYDNNNKIFFSHKGSTFGGIVIGQNFYDIKHIYELINILESYLKKKGYTQIVLKNTPEIFSKYDLCLIDYFLFQADYNSYSELSFYISYNDMSQDIISNFSSGKRRDYRYSLKEQLVFKPLKNDEDIIEFHYLLEKNLLKFGKVPVHTANELCDFKNMRLSNSVSFFGVYKDEQMIAGSMVFLFQNFVYHTQYLVSDPNYSSLFPMNYLITRLIENGKNEGYNSFSFGISTENQGKYLNYGLAQFKEGFGTSYYLNKTYYKSLNGVEI